MPAKIAKMKLGHLTIKAVFRHKWDSPEDAYVNSVEYKTKRLGIFARRSLGVGTKLKGKALFTKGNLFPIYLVGVDLIVAKAWLEFSWRVRTFTTSKPQVSKTHIPHDGC
jgi:tetrahydromethanopterin S-methyltransferase subunit F